MMTESEIIRLVREIIRQEITAVMMATVKSNESQTRSTLQRNQTEGPVPHLRSILPYGISTRAPAGTPGLIVPVDGNATHLNMVGHFDEGRPTTEDGEIALYASDGRLLYVSNGKIQIGSKAASENLVLGQVFKAFASELLQLLADHTHAGIGYPPTNKADFLALKESPIEDEVILSDDNFTEKGG